MANIERKPKDINQPNIQRDPINVQDALRTTPGDYYFEQDARTIRPEILEKITMVSKGKN